MVYVDDFFKFEPWCKFGRMKMSHMIADTKSELLEMASQLHLKPSYIQYPNEPKKCHFDVSISKRKEAIALGAQEIKYRDIAKYTCDIHH